MTATTTLREPVTLQEALVAILEADAVVMASAPGGVDSPQRLSSATRFPALRFTTVSDVQLVVSDGATDTQRMRIQLDSFAYSWVEAKTLDLATLAALCPMPNARRIVGAVCVDGIIPELSADRFEANTGLHMLSRVFVAWGGPA